MMLLAYFLSLFFTRVNGEFTYHIVSFSTGYMINNFLPFLSTEFPSWVRSASYDSNVDLVILHVNSAVNQNIIDDVESGKVRVAMLRAVLHNNQFDSAFTSASYSTSSITITANHEVLTEGFTIGQSYNLGFTYKSKYIGVGSNYQVLATVSDGVALAYHKSRPIALLPYYAHQTGNTGNLDGQRLIRNVFQWLWDYQFDPTKAPSTSPTAAAEYIHNADLGTIEFCGSAIFNGENVFVYNSRQTERANYDDWDTFCLVNAKGVALGGNGNSNRDCAYAMSQIEIVTSFSHQSDDYPPNRPHGSNIYFLCTVDTELGFVDDTSCQWHAMNKMNKVINANQFFGFECPPNQIISELRLEGYGARSVLENNPTAILCCELGGYTLVTNTCVDSYSTADGILEAAICQGNSAMAAIYDLSDPTLEQGQWQYQATKAVTCCDIEYDTSYGHNLDLGIDRSQCEVISHSNQVGSFDVSCPEDMILIAIRDNDLAHGVQEVHEVECCKVHQATAPSKAPTATPTTDQPSSAPTTSCYRCLIEVHGNNVSDQDDFVDEIEACLSHCCA